MAALANAYQRADVSNELEDVMGVIIDVSPTETPGVSNAPEGSTDQTYAEWDRDDLDAVDANNAHIDGDVFSADAITGPVRVGNHCQIARKDFSVTRRGRKLRKTGQRDELLRQVVRKGRALKRDMEKISLANQASVTDNGTVAPKLGGVLAWLETNTSRGVGGSDGGFASGAITAATNGTVRALTEDGLLGLTKDQYEVADDPLEIMMLSPTNKQNFSKYMFGNSARIATQYQNQGTDPRGGVTAVGAVDVWVTDFDTIDVVPNRFFTDRDVLLYNPDSWEVCYFDRMGTDAMGKTADSAERMVLVDWTVKVLSEKSMAVFADVDHTTAMVAS